MNHISNDKMNAMFKSVIDMDRNSVVICDTGHKIVYMNPAAVKNYSKSGGKALLGSSVLDCHNERSREIILKVFEWFSQDVRNNMISLVYLFYQA